MGTLITAGILLLVGTICWFFIHGKKKLLNSIENFPKRCVSEILSSAGSGAFQTAKLRGKIMSDEPLVSELTETPCVYYEMEVVRKYRTRERVKDSTGQSKMETKTHTERIAHNIKSQDFYLDDGTGRIKVSLVDADFDKERVLDRFSPSTESDMSLNFGSFSFNLDGILNRERTLGYIYREWVLPLQKEIFVVCGVRKAEQPYLAAPDDDRYRYIISFLDEIELIKRIKKDAFWLQIVTVLCLLFGFLALAYGLIETGIIK